MFTMIAPCQPRRRIRRAAGLLCGGLWWVALMFGRSPTAQPSEGYGLLREVWEGIPGNAIAELTGSPDFPDRPTSTNYVTDLFEAPIDVLEEYGQRMHGYLVPPLTGQYTFWIATDDNGELHLSTDENPANTRLIAFVANWTSPRAWDWEGNQQSEPIRLEAGKAYYIAALMKEGGGGDNLAVRWLMPDGTDQGPMVATNLLPYGISFKPPQIAEHPASVTAVEGGLARFEVRLSGVGLYTYQWRRNGTPIPGATESTLTLDPVRRSDDSARFTCAVSNTQGSVTSLEAILTVTPDTTPPRLISARNLGPAQVEVVFSEAVAAPSATTVANYRLNNGATLSKAAFGTDQTTVILTTSVLTLGAAYTLEVSGVHDQAQSPNTLEAGATVGFVPAEYTPQTIGNPPLAGSAVPRSDGVDVRGSGQLGGTSDACQFAWQQRTGDFDERTRLAAFDPTDPFARAGLMARESFAPNSRFVAAVATPGTVGCFFLARTTPGGGANPTGFFPVNYPATWLRLKRAGNTFTAYAGYDGEAWVELGRTTVTLPATVYLGPAVGSRNAAQLATAAFRDFGTSSGGTVVTYQAGAERSGPSSRQTPFVFSEIMYHPAERTDGRDAEFVELYNADLIAQDLTGHRLSGSIDYAFPDGTVLPAGGFLVIARNPVDFAGVYGLANALGPFANTNSLPNDTGLLRLRNPEGTVLLEVDYDTRPPWPAAADGAGHSLVLVRPSYGEADPRAWAASARVGGSPGQMEAVLPHPRSAVLINEFLAHTDDPVPDFIELYNHSNQAVDVSGCILTDDPTTNRFVIPPQTVMTPRGFVAFDQTQLGFRLNAAGETLYLFSPDRTRAIDAIRFEAQENGVASGRFPDGSPEVRRLEAPSPAAENLPFRVSEVAINEILYNPVSGDSADEYVELHNRTPNPIDLTDWRFTDGIDYRFPRGARIAPNGYVVVAKDIARFLSRYPALEANLVFGNFDGTLANGGERLAFARPDRIVVTNEFGLLETNRIDLELDEVTYGTGGRWGRWSDGLGSSLELIDPTSDHRRASNWADSDESAKAPWTTVEFTGRLDNGDGGAADRLHLMLQGPGECIVDDVEVLPAAGANRVTNPGFETGLGNWIVQGNHRSSAAEAGVGYGGTAGLRVRATGRGDTACNRIYVPLTSSLANNSTATLRARVRWVRGWPEFLLRLRGSYLEAPGRLSLPTNLGTPGARNSRAVPNAGPAIYHVVHAPILPIAGQPAVVTARLSDPDGIGAVRLHYRTDPGGQDRTVTMTDDGRNGDAVAGDGVWAGRIPAQSAHTMIAFYVEAADTRPGAAVTARFPADAPTHECLARWGETQPTGNLGVYRLWQRQDEYNFLRWRESLANDNIDATFAYDDGRVMYNIEMRAKGSPWHGGSVGYDYVFTFPDDDRFLGARDVALVSLGNLGGEDTGQREQAAFWIGRQLGVPTLHRRHALFFENGERKQQVYEDTEEPNGAYADRWWPEGQDGDLYKVEDWFEFDDGGTSFTFSRDATLQRFTTLGGGYKLARYRWAWRKRAVVQSANDYTHFFNLVTAVNASGAAFVPQVENLVDVENWMRLFALQHIVGNWDAYGYNRGKNSYIYKPVNGRFQMIPWDIDFVLGSGSDGTSTDLFGANDPVVTKLWNTPAFRRVYLRAFWDATHGPLLNERIDPILDARYQALTANGIGVTGSSPIKSWIRNRRNYINGRLASMDVPALTITSNQGNDFESAQPKVTLSGAAPIAIRTLEVNGVALPVTWTTPTGWSLDVSLGARTNTLVVTGLDTWGRPVPGATDSITIRYTGAELPSPAGLVVINEIMYHPSQPDAGFLELHNQSLTVSFDLSGWRLDGVGFTFPEGVVLGPGGYAVVAKNRDAFAAAYGFGVLPVGEYPGSLQNDGELLALIRPGPEPSPDLIVDQVRYDRQPPWPPQADGLGPSLQLVDPQQDNWPVANWRAANPGDAVLATPGRVNSVAGSLPPFPRLFLNEALPRNLTGAVDGFGDLDPWIELYNAGPETLDLSGLYLTDDYGNLARWPFPAGTTLPPRQFLVVWADGEPGESSAGELHTNFRLAPTHGAVALVRLQSGAYAVVDYLNYRNQPNGLALGSYPDGQPQQRQLFHIPTPGAPNTPGAPAAPLFVNEWLASNNGLVADPADGDFDDWFELYNAGARAVDLSAYTLSDVPTDPAKFTIPNGTTIPPDGFLLVWADEEPEQTGPTQLHVNFRLAAGGEHIGLYAPDGRPVDLVQFARQTNNISEGRFPDGMAEPFVFMGVPTPGEPNAFATINLPPRLEPIDPAAIDEGQTLAFTAIATDPDEGQQLTFALVGAPPEATIQPDTGLFRWTTAEPDGPAEYSFLVRVTDDGKPRRSDTRTVTVLVREVNQPPELDPIADYTVGEGDLLTFSVGARDADLPPQPLRFTLDPGAPADATIHPGTGTFTWIPPEESGPGRHAIAVRVTDDAPVPRSATRTFHVMVNEVDNAPVFAPVGLQTVNELAPFHLDLEAIDPDTPPRTVTFALEQGPPRLALDPATGRVTWTPREQEGPNSYNVVVRASEVGGTRSSTLAFSIVVNEVNQAPSLPAIPGFAVAEGTTLTFTNQAWDVDLPRQKLAFRLLPGAPAGATVDPQTGVFAWPVGADAGPSTNAFTIEVTDDALEARSARQAFQVVVVAQPRIVINEIMYQPTAAGAEYVELHNTSTNTPWSLAGWRLAGTEFRFPDGRVLAPGAFLAVARNVSLFKAAYGEDLPVIGNYGGQFGPDGGVVQLLRPLPAGGEEIVDAVRFSRQAPWPTNANGTGASLQLIDAHQDNSRVANWAAVNTTIAQEPRNVIPMDATWRYWQDAADPAPGWTNRVYDDRTWPAGDALLYVEGAALPAPKNTELRLGPMSFLFRTKFTFEGNPEGASLQLNTVLDDGAVFYLNGKEFFRLGVEEGIAVERDTPSSRTIGDAVLEGPFVRPVDNLESGENVLAVEVHQTNPGSSDIVLGVAVDVIEVRRASYTPGIANSVRAVLEPFPSLWLSEVLANNQSGLRDAAGDRDPWIELMNGGPEPVALEGYFLANNLANLTQWTWPANAGIPAGAYRLVWADAEPGETAATEWHANFRLSTPSGLVALVRQQQGRPVVIDYLEYTGLAPDRSYGYTSPRLTGTAPAVLPQPTPGASNAAPSPPPPEIVALDLASEDSVDLTWTSVAGVTYRVEAKGRLDEPVWQPLGQVLATGPTARFRDATVRYGRDRYYRIAMPAVR